MYITIKALVLRITDYNDKDALINVLTAEHGLLTLKARGLRRKNSPLTGCCQLLAYSEFTLFEYKGAYSINEGRPLELFLNLRSDLQKLSLGTYFAQVAQVVAQEDTPSPDLLSLLLNCLHGLSQTDIPERQIKGVFELRCVCIAGFLPDLSGCHVCGEPHPDRIDISNGVLVCSRCRGLGNDGLRLPVSAGVLQALRYLVDCDSKAILRFRLSEESVENFSRITEAYLSTQLERGFSALDFYKSLFV